MTQGFDPFNPARQRQLEELKALSERFEREMDLFLTRLLPVLDKVEQTCRGIDSKSAEELADSARMLALLPEVADNAAESIGLARIGGVGEPGNSVRHEVKHTRPSELPRGTVLEVLDYGWEYDGRILRRAMVCAAVPKPEHDTD